MNYNEELMNYQADAEEHFDDFVDEVDDGDYYQDTYDTGLEGLEDDYYEEDGDWEEEGHYDNYSRTSIGRIDPNDRTLTVVVENTGDEAAEAIIFGGNENAAQPTGVTVNVQESSHGEVREESKSNPFKIRGMKMSVSDSLQFDRVLNITRKTATGTRTTQVYQPRNATSPQNFNARLIDDGSFEVDITGQDSIRTTVLGSVTLVFTFTIKARANMGNLLKGANVAELSNAPRTTGLPQLDMIQQRRARQRRLARHFRRRQAYIPVSRKRYGADQRKKKPKRIRPA